MTVKEYIEELRGMCIKMKCQEVISIRELRIIKELEKEIERAEKEHTGSIGIYDFKDENPDYPLIPYKRR